MGHAERIAIITQLRSIMPKQTFNGGTHNHYYQPPEQTEFQFVNKDAIIPARFYPKEKNLIAELAKNRGRSVSDFVREIVLKHLRSEKKLHEVYQLLDEIL